MYHSVTHSTFRNVQSFCSGCSVDAFTKIGMFQNPGDQIFTNDSVLNVWNMFNNVWLRINISQIIMWHCNDVIMSAVASQITSLTIVYSSVYSGTDQRKYQSSASLAFVWVIHRWPVNSPDKWPVTWKIFPFHDVIMGWNPSPIWSALGIPCPHKRLLFHGSYICKRKQYNLDMTKTIPSYMEAFGMHLNIPKNRWRSLGSFLCNVCFTAKMANVKKAHYDIFKHMFLKPRYALTINI